MKVIHSAATAVHRPGPARRIGCRAWPVRTTIPAPAIIRTRVAIGLYDVSFHVHADDIAGPYTPPGLNVRNPSINTLYLAYMRRLSPHFDAELALGVPPLTRTVAKGPATVGSVPYNGQTIATVRWLAPSLLLKYYLFSPDAMFRPYLGVGVNYTKFYSRQVTAGRRCHQRRTDLPVAAGIGGARGHRRVCPGSRSIGWW